jgi:hypothetical protein
MNTIEDKWNDYEGMVVPVKAGPYQRIECRRAFYGGAFAYGCILSDLPDDISEDAGAMVIEGLREEIIAYLEMEEKVGATGDFPDGKSQENDEGEIRLAVTTNVKKGLIGMDFGKPVAWMQFSAKDARNLAAVLAERAYELEEYERRHPHGTRSRKV